MSRLRTRTATIILLVACMIFASAGAALAAPRAYEKEQKGPPERRNRDDLADVASESPKDSSFWAVIERSGIDQAQLKALLQAAARALQAQDVLPSATQPRQEISGYRLERLGEIGGTEGSGRLHARVVEREIFAAAAAKLLGIESMSTEHMGMRYQLPGRSDGYVRDRLADRDESAEKRRIVALMADSLDMPVGILALALQDGPGSLQATGLSPADLKDALASALHARDDRNAAGSRFRSGPTGEAADPDSEPESHRDSERRRILAAVAEELGMPLEDPVFALPQRPAALMAIGLSLQEPQAAFDSVQGGGQGADLRGRRSSRGRLADRDAPGIPVRMILEPEAVLDLTARNLGVHPDVLQAAMQAAVRELAIHERHDRRGDFGAERPRRGRARNGAFGGAPGIRNAEHGEFRHGGLYRDNGWYQNIHRSGSLDGDRGQRSDFRGRGPWLSEDLNGRGESSVRDGSDARRDDAESRGRHRREERD